MKIKLGELVTTREGLNKLVRAELPVKTAYWIGKMIKSINTEFNELETKRMELIKKYGEEVVEKEKKTGNWKVKEENMEVFAKEMEELTGIEIDLNFNPISLDDIAEAKLCAGDLMSLDPLLKAEVEATVTPIKNVKTK